MEKHEFKTRWESGDDGGGITFDHIAYCAQKWGIFQNPKTKPIETVRYAVLRAAGVTDAEEYKPKEDC